MPHAATPAPPPQAGADTIVNQATTPGAAPAKAASRSRLWIFLIPLAAFAVLAVFLGRGLSLNPREVPSPLIGKPAPSFTLARLDDAAVSVKSTDFQGKVWVLNVWASWCGPCRDEHPLWVDFARRSKVPIVGLNYKDQRGNALPWLRQLGDPYLMSLFDGDGKVAIDWGVYGVPETFVIDRQGIVRFKHVGPVTAELLRKKIEPLLKSLDA
jgi:cytochrome c biogenesis protein CcmG/thiol:disulfide interchange protein DsbE